MAAGEYELSLVVGVLPGLLGGLECGRPQSRPERSHGAMLNSSNASHNLVVRV